ncbi:MAG: hypothetical protein K1X81_07165 [Bacteroidia bacterium]|nr:hypothetical protein [Bacteroidia bacterium]
MNRIFTFLVAAMGLISCGTNEQAKLENQSIAFEKTLRFLHNAYVNWPAQLEQNETICRQVKKKACSFTVKNALDTIAQRKTDYANFKQEFNDLELNWESFKNSPQQNKNYADFRKLCTRLNHTEILMDYWGNSVAEEMAKVSKCFEQNR